MSAYGSSSDRRILVSPDGTISNVGATGKDAREKERESHEGNPLSDFGPTYEKIWPYLVSVLGISGAYSVLKSAGLFAGSKKLIGDGQSVLSETGDNGSGFSLKDLLFGSGSGSGSGILSGLGSSLLGLGTEYASSVLNYENQMKMIKYQNEYNTPKNQMARFSEAGLNPNLIYGLGSNGNQPAAGTPAPADFDTAQRENRIQSENLKLQKLIGAAEIGEKQSNINLNNANASLVTKQGVLSDIEAMYKGELFKSDLSLKSQQLDNMIQEKRNMLAEERNIQARTQTENQLRELTKQKFASEIALNQFNSKTSVQQYIDSLEKTAESAGYTLKNAPQWLFNMAIDQIDGQTKIPTLIKEGTKRVINILKSNSNEFYESKPNKGD